METRQRTQPASDSFAGPAKAALLNARHYPRGPPRCANSDTSPGRTINGAAEAPTSTAPKRTPDPCRVHVRVTARHLTRHREDCLAPRPARWDAPDGREQGISASWCASSTTANRQELRHMPVPAPQPQDTAAIVAIVLVVAAFCARYWRTVLLMIMISLLIFTVLGLIAGLHDVQQHLR